MTNNQLINYNNTGVGAQKTLEGVPCEVLPIAAPQQIRNVDVALTIDVNEIVKTTMDGMLNIVKMMSGFTSDNSAMSDENTIGTYHLAVTPGRYVGVYNNRGYGVYDNIPTLNDALPYITGYQAEEFSSYDEAVDFVQRGYCSLTNVDITRLSSVLSPNWFERPGNNASEANKGK